MEALEVYTAANPYKLQNLRLITGIGGRRETLTQFDSDFAGGLNLVTPTTALP